MESLFFDIMTLSWDLDLLMADALRYNMPVSASNKGGIRPPRDHHLLLHWTIVTNIHALFTRGVDGQSRSVMDGILNGHGMCLDDLNWR